MRWLLFFIYTFPLPLRSLNMAQAEKKPSIPGVAEGKQLVGVPTDESLSSEERVKAFIVGAMAGSEYRVLLRLSSGAFTSMYSLTDLLLSRGGALNSSGQSLFVSSPPLPSPTDVWSLNLQSMPRNVIDWGTYMAGVLLPSSTSARRLLWHQSRSPASGHTQELLGHCRLPIFDQWRKAMWC